MGSGDEQQAGCVDNARRLVMRTPMRILCAAGWQTMDQWD